MYRLLILSVFLVGVSIYSQQQQQQRPRRVTNNADQTNTTQKPSSGDSQDLDEGDVIRTDTQLVSVPAVVTDSTGRPLSGLKPDNFRITEDGQPQTIANFGTAETPFEIALLLDTSGSTRDDVALIRDVVVVAFRDRALARHLRIDTRRRRTHSRRCVEFYRRAASR